ncbi:MAG: trigger factor [bacterium]|nr:trigger factor [bacterium]
MEINLKRGKNSEAELKVELTQEDLKQYIKKAGEEVAASVAMDGFRAGKVPLDVVRKKVGDEKILEVAMDLAIKESFFQAIKKEKVDIISSSDLKVIDNTAEKLKYEVKIILFPEVKLGEYKNLGMSLKPVSVSEEEVQDTLKYIQKTRAEYKEVETPAEKDHRLEIDFEVKDKGAVIDGGKSENHPVVLGEGNFIPGFEDHLVGMKKGETKNFSLEVPGDYYQKSVAGKKLDFLVTIKTIKGAILPELTDDFAKSLGKFESVEDLKKNVSRGLQSERDQKERDRVRLLILDKVNEKTEMEVPDKMVEEQLDIMVSNFDQNLHARGLELSLYLTQISKTQDELRKEWRERAVKQIRQGLIMRAISKAEEIKVGEEEVAQAVGALLSRYAGAEELQAKVDPEELKNRAKESLLNEKVFDYLEKENIKEN